MTKRENDDQQKGQDSVEHGRRDFLKDSGVVAVGLAATAVAGASTASAAEAAKRNIPVLVPLTGFLSFEGTSQRNGAELALRDAGNDLGIQFEIIDTGTSPQVAMDAFVRALDDPDVIAVVAPMLGDQMLALLPLAEEFAVPMITVTGTARVTELGNPYVFRFFPSDAVVKQAHARYAVEELGVKRPAIVYQTTAYGQSGRRYLAENLTRLGSPPVLEEALDVSVKDMLPTLTKVRQSSADALLLHLHSGPMALVIRQAAAMGLGVPIVAGSAMHQPQTAALLEPPHLALVCAESGSSPISGGDDRTERFAERYRATYGAEPDAFALGQYDAVMMVLATISEGAHTREAVREALATRNHRGLAMTYRSDGKGNMAHDALIICYDGESRVPRIVKRYENVTGLP